MKNPPFGEKMCLGHFYPSTSNKLQSSEAVDDGNAFRKAVVVSRFPKSLTTKSPPKKKA